jgi:hypothetical protein
MLSAQLLGCFDDLGNGFFAGEKGEKKAIGGFGGREEAEEVGMFGHKNLQTN